jgi:hypothetical protein
MATKANKTKKKAIADIAHPGTTAPSDTSKSIITHRPMIKDPMVVEGTETDENEASSTKSALVKTSELRLEPPKAESTDKTEETKPEELESLKEKSVENTSAEKSEKTEEPDETREESESTGDQPDEVDKEPSKADKQLETKKSKMPDPDVESAQQAAAEAKRQQIIDSKKYFLPINTVEHRRSRRFVMLGIVVAVLLLLAWADIALDAGIIHLDGIKPLTHFFSG